MHEDLLAYYQLWAEAAETDTVNVQELWDLYEYGNGRVAAYARNSLLALAEIEYREPLLHPDNFKVAEAQQAYVDLLGELPPQRLKIIPNPAKDYIIVTWQLEWETEAEIEVYNLKGNLVDKFATRSKKDQKLLDVNRWEPGTYIVSIKINDSLIESVKFTVVP